MTGSAPGDEPGRTPTDVPAQGSEFAGGPPGGPGEGISASSVQIAYLHGSRVSHSWHQSMMHTLTFDKTVGLNVIESMPYAVSCSGPNSLVEGRNMAVTYFLDGTDAEWLLFVDTDMGFQADSLQRLLLAADPVERPVVGALCFAMKHMGPDGQGGFRVMPVPTLFEFAKNEQQGIGFANRFIYPPDSLIRVAGTGAAFLLIHREVLDQIRKNEGDHWFDFIQYGDGAQVSEDLSFCWRLAQAGVPLHVDTRVKVTHHKELWLGENDYHMPPREPMGKMIEAAKAELGPTLGHKGSDRWTGGDKKDER